MRRAHTVRSTTGWSLLIAAVLLATPLLQTFAAPSAQVMPQTVDTPATQAAERALAWLRTQQGADGSFSPGSTSAVGATADVIIAAAATGADALTWSASAGQPTVYDYLAGNAAAYVDGTNAGNAGKLLVAIVAANHDPRAFAGLDLVATTLAYHDGAGGFAGNGIHQAWAMLGLLAAHEPLPAGATSLLAQMQQPDGGWDSGWGTDSGSTALALQALVAAAYTDTDGTVLADGLEYLRQHQSATAGFFSTDAWGSTDADTDSTAVCTQALIALGQNPLSAGWQVGGRSALDDLLDAQLASGAFAYQPGATANVMSTVAALPALVGRPLPIAGARVAVWHTLRYLAEVQQTDGSFEGTVSASSEGLLALIAAGELPRTWRPDGSASLVDYLASAADQTVDSGQVGRLAAALAMADENPYLVGNTNLLARLWEYYDADTGSFDSYGENYNQVLAIWGLVSAGEAVPAKAVEWLWGQQNTDGGWGWGSGMGSDTNSTALVLQALIAAGAARSDARITKALQYLRSQQAADAGFSWDIHSPWDSGPDANSTALVVQGLLAADPSALTDLGWARTLTDTSAITLTVHTPVDRLMAFQLPSGAFEWQPGPYGGPNFVATVEAIPALSLTPFPWKHQRLPAARSALAWLLAQQHADGSFGTTDRFTATAQAVLAGVALGASAEQLQMVSGMPTALDYLASHIVEAEGDAERTGMLLAALIAANQNVRDWTGVNVLSSLIDRNDGSGQYGSSASAQAWAMIGLAAARYPVSPQAVAVLSSWQAPDGRWPGDAPAIDDTATTALALQALAAAGVEPTDARITAGLAYLRARQNASGAFGANAASSTTNVRATSAAIQAILATGGDPRAEGWLVNGRSVLDELAARQLAAGGWELQPGSGADALTTAQALPATLLEINPLCTRQAAIIVALPLALRGH